MEWVQFYKNLVQIVDPKCSIIKDDTQGKITYLKRREFQRGGWGLIYVETSTTIAPQFFMYLYCYDSSVISVGLELVANNKELLYKELFNNYKQWYFDLLAWSKSSNASDNSVGRKAMLAYLKAVFDYVLKEADVLQSDFLDGFVSVS